jgi:hypothetical protein
VRKKPCQQKKGVSILTIRFVFGSDKFSKRYGTLACEADPHAMCDVYDSHITFPGSTVAFLQLCCRLRKGANTPFFSDNFSRLWLNQLPERCLFSHIKFLDVVENAVLRGLGTREMIQTTTWKSYARKSAAFTARARSCSEILSENGEKYPEN